MRAAGGKNKRGTKVRPNRSLPSTKVQVPSNSNWLWEVLVIIVLLVCCLVLMQQMFLDHVHNNSNKEATTTGAATENSIKEVATPTRGAWEKFEDPSTHENYYHNIETQETVWETPFAWKDGEEKNGWVRWLDTNSSEFFYENTKDNSLVWEPPADAFPEDKTSGNEAAGGGNEAAGGGNEAAGGGNEAGSEESLTGEECRGDWCRFKDATTLTYFYANTNTKATTWAIPGVWKDSGVSAEAIPEEKDGWIRIPSPKTMEKKSEDTGSSASSGKESGSANFYFFEPATKTIQWEVPKAWEAAMKSAPIGGALRGSQEEDAAAASMKTNTKTKTKTKTVTTIATAAVASGTTLGPGEVEKGGWIQVSEPVSGKYYYYKKDDATKKTFWSAPDPFLTKEEKAAKQVSSSSSSSSSSLSSSSSVSTESCAKYDIIENKDIRGADVSTAHGTEAKDCCKACNEHPMCKSFTFHVDKCWLKSSMISSGGAVQKDGLTSGFSKR